MPNNRGMQTINWGLIRAYFVTQTMSNNSDAETLNSVAKRFNISNAALSKVAGNPDKTGKTWYDYRNEFVQSKAGDDNADKIRGIISKIEKNRNFISVVNSVVNKEVIEALKDPETKRKFIAKLKPKDILDMNKYEMELNSKLIDYTKQGLTNKGTSIILNVDKPLEEMTVDELDKLINKVETFGFDDAEYSVIEE